MSYHVTSLLRVGAGLCLCIYFIFSNWVPLAHLAICHMTAVFSAGGAVEMFCSRSSRSQQKEDVKGRRDTPETDNVSDAVRVSMSLHGGRSRNIVEVTWRTKRTRDLHFACLLLPPQSCDAAGFLFWHFAWCVGHLFLRAITAPNVPQRSLTCTSHFHGAFNCLLLRRLSSAHQLCFNWKSFNFPRRASNWDQF